LSKLFIHPLVSLAIVQPDILEPALPPKGMTWQKKWLGFVFLFFFFFFVVLKQKRPPSISV
jgi:hypothetical protein